jgi:2-polyprenyl-6-methoxyphenol hydroxylase-like FAD-dependent oxidoreductase
MMAAGSRVAIVGAGVGGLAAALYLHRQGHEVTVIERFSEARPVGSGLLLQPVGLAVLDDLGLLETICRLGKRVDHLRGNDCDSGRLVLDVGYRQGQFAIGIHRAALFQTLRDAVAAAGIAVLTSLEVSGTRRTGPQIELLDPAGKPLASPFTCVIDAAGAHSPLSAAVRRSKPLSYGAFWATVNWPAAAGFDSSALQQRYKWASVMIGVLPVGRQTLGSPEQAAFFWSLKRDDVAGVVATGIDLWKDRVLGLWPDTAPLLDQIAGFDDLTFAAYGHHTLAEPFSDGLFHIGDSAHATSPQLGQGANMALLDARALAHALSTTDSLGDAGRAYARMRRSHVRLYQAMSRYLTPFYQSDSAIIPLARDTLVSTVARIPPMPTVLAALVSGTLIDPLRPIGLKLDADRLASAVGSGTVLPTTAEGTPNHEADSDRDDPRRGTSEHPVGRAAHG